MYSVGSTLFVKTHKFFFPEVYIYVFYIKVKSTPLLEVIFPPLLNLDGGGIPCLYFYLSDFQIVKCVVMLQGCYMGLAKQALVYVHHGLSSSLL